MTAIRYNSPVRSRPFQHAMTRFALVAMLLLAFVPTANRLLASVGIGVQGSWVELCTVTGLKWVQLSAEDAAPPAHAGHASEGDCAYCPLLNAVAVLALLLALLAPALPRQLLAGFASAPHGAGLHPCGLGSRGPPILL